MTKNDWKRSLLAGAVAVAAAPALFAAPAAEEALLDALGALALPLERSGDLDPLLDRVGDRPFVLLGESTHGTSEFYHWRDQISRRLIMEKDFRYIAVEGDWEACYRVNRYVKHHPGAGESAREILAGFDRWPTWLWANDEVAALVEWLREHNRERPPSERVGFYGIDLYGPEASMREVAAYLRAHDPEGAALAERVEACMRPYWSSFNAYARATRSGEANCAEAVDALARHLAQSGASRDPATRKAWFNAKRNAAVVRGAESHYRAMGQPDESSWNVRVAHFLETVERLMDYKGEGARGIVWAHNTHVGDARATAMAEYGSTNIGQLLRQRHGESKVFAVGFGTHRGTVLAGRAWGAPMERMAIPHGAPGSVEDAMHQAARRMGRERFLLLFGHADRGGPIGALRGHRAIGVVYDPANERGNYVPTRVPRRYDAFIFIDETKALSPVHR